LVLVFFILLIATLVLLLMLVVFGFTLRALASLLVIPGEFAGIVGRESVRRNHALQHATINVIEERFGSSGLEGRTLKHGFTLDGAASADEVLTAAQEGLSRLKAGEHRLAMRRRCGSTLAPAGFLCAMVFLGVLLAAHQLSLLNIVIAVLLANALSPVVSNLLQRFFSSVADVSGLCIVGLSGEPASFRPREQASSRPAERYHVRTAPSGEGASRAAGVL
jgi:hypothetical protein